MKKETAIIVIAFVGVIGFLSGFTVCKLRVMHKPKAITVVRYSEMTNAATVIHRVEPTYPESALRDRIEGTVRLEVAISANGSVTSADIVKGVRDDIDNAAKEAVRLWKFAPASAGGKAVSGPAIVSLDFKLDTAKSAKH
jgi:protein TonB